MKTLFLIIFISVNCLCFAGSVIEPITVGDWSEPTNGLRGRLLFSEDAKFYGTEMGVVYLELQNVSDVGNPMEIYYDDAKELHCQIADASGKSFHQPGMLDASIILSFGSYWIALPHDSILRLRVSVNGYGVPKDGGLLIGLQSDAWLIPPTLQTDLFFSGSFNVNPSQDKDHIHAWKGVLELPNVKIPAKRP